MLDLTAVWAKTLTIFQSNWQIVLFGIVLSLTLNTAIAVTSANPELANLTALLYVAYFIAQLIWLFLAVSAHVAILYQHTEVNSLRNIPVYRSFYWPFFWKSLLITLITIPVLLVSGLPIYLISLGNGPVMFLTFQVVIYGVLAIFGSCLPATIAGGNRSLSSTWGRSRDSFSFVFKQLILGPAALTTGMAVATYLFWHSVGQVFTDVVLQPFDHPILFFVFQVPEEILLAITIILTASILCNAYLHSTSLVNPNTDIHE